MIEVCLVGLRGYAQTHLGWIRENQAKGRLRFRSMTILPEEQEAERETVDELINEGVKIFPNTKNMFDEGKGELQLCFLPTSIASHKPLTLEALEAGCHVLVEKPLAGTNEDVREIVDARDRHGLSVTVGFQDISRRDVHLIKAGLKEGEWGNLKSINFTAIWPRHHRYYQRNSWAGKLQHHGSIVNDSPANNATAHYLNMGLFVAGDEPHLSAEATSVEGDLLRSRDIESFDTMSVRFNLNTGIPLRYTVSHSSPEQLGEELSFQTDEGELVISARAVLWRPDDGPEQDLSVDDVNDGRRNMVDSVLDLIEKNNSVLPNCSLEIAGSHVRAIEAMHRDLEVVSIPPSSLLEEGGIISIQEIDKAISEARTQGLTFSELGWSFT